jgi:hypothetical protein
MTRATIWLLIIVNLIVLMIDKLKSESEYLNGMKGELSRFQDFLSIPLIINK